MRLCSIASGSSGNCIYVGSDKTHLMIDAGISGKRIEDGMNEIGLKTAEMDGILITHEHSDHISGLGVVARKHGIPIYATRGTIDAILRMKGLGTIDKELFREIEPEQDFTIGDVTVSPVTISHDAAQPTAYIMCRMASPWVLLRILENMTSTSSKGFRGLISCCWRPIMTYICCR